MVEENKHNLDNIRIFLFKCFSADDMRNWCNFQNLPDETNRNLFEDLKYQVTNHDSSTALAGKIVSHFKRKLGLNHLLIWLKEKEPKCYQAYQPYFLYVEQERISFTSSERAMMTSSDADSLEYKQSLEKQLTSHRRLLHKTREHLAKLSIGNPQRIELELQVEDLERLIERKSIELETLNQQTSQSSETAPPITASSSPVSPSSLTEASAERATLKEQYRNLEYRRQGLELTKSRQGLSFSAIDQSELLRVYDELKEIKKRLGIE